MIGSPFRSDQEYICIHTLTCDCPCGSRRVIIYPAVYILQLPKYEIGCASHTSTANHHHHHCTNTSNPVGNNLLMNKPVAIHMFCILCIYIDVAFVCARYISADNAPSRVLSRTLCMRRYVRRTFSSMCVCVCGLLKRRGKCLRL